MRLFQRRRVATVHKLDCVRWSLAYQWHGLTYINIHYGQINHGVRHKLERLVKGSGCALDSGQQQWCFCSDVSAYMQLIHWCVSLLPLCLSSGPCSVSEDFGSGGAAQLVWVFLGWFSLEVAVSIGEKKEVSMFTEILQSWLPWWNINRVCRIHLISTWWAASWSGTIEKAFGIHLPYVEPNVSTTTCGGNLFVFFIILLSLH